MVKFLKTLFSFLVVLGLGYSLLTILVGGLAPKGVAKNLKYPKNGTGFLRARLADADTTNDIDILVIGSSHAYRGYDPRIFKQHGINLFNLGSSSQTFIQSEFLMKNYLDKLHPKKVIIDVYAGLLASDGMESSLDIIANAHDIPFFNNFSLLRRNFDVNTANALLYSVYDRLIESLHDDSLMLREEGDRYIDNGYVENKGSYVRSSLPPFEIKIKETQIEALARLAGILEERRIPYILVQTPITNVKRNSLVNMHDADTVFSKYGRYVNFDGMIGMDDSFFLDDHHLNQKGAATYNEELVNYLSKIDF